MQTDDSEPRETKADQYEKHLRSPIETVRSDLYNIAMRIQYYRELFYEDSERVALLNRTASTFFFVVQDELFTGIVIGLSRATDPSRMGEHTNLSLPYLIEIIDNLERRDASTLIANLKSQMKSIGKEVAGMRRLRNKRIAHRDLDHALQAKLELGTSMKEIEGTYESIGSFMNEIELFFTNCTHGYPTEFFASRNGALSLIGALKRSARETSEGEET